tara:strand:- start:4554 stop:5792 length:1239 start_codon:yes stop_codon:yes gene_type:complete
LDIFENGVAAQGVIHMSNILVCSKCLLPETVESLVIGDDGVCSVCKNISYKHTSINWEERGHRFDEILDAHRGQGQYDCVVPFSGGKDSTYTLWYLVKVKKLKPLVVRFDHGFFRPTLQDNALKTFRRLGVDVHNFTPNFQVVRKLMYESLRRKGDFCWHCHTGIFAYPMWVSIRYETPLVIWGESGAEYSSWYSFEEQEEMDQRRFDLKINRGIAAEDMIGMLDNSISGYPVTSRDLIPFSYPPRRDLKKAGTKSVFLGRYIPWDVKYNYATIQKELDWKGEQVEGVPPQYDYEKIECFMQGVRDYIKFLKRGYARTAHLASIDIRNGRLTREEGQKLVDQYDGKRPYALDLFLDYLGITEEHFHDLVKMHEVRPHTTPSCGECQRCQVVPWDAEMWQKIGSIQRTTPEIL